MSETDDFREIWDELRPTRPVPLRPVVPSPVPRGVSRPYATTRRVTFGGQGIALETGARVFFDGETLLVPGHEPINMPQFQSAIRLGWVVPDPTEPDAPDVSPRTRYTMEARLASGRRLTWFVEGPPGIRDPEALLPLSFAALIDIDVSDIVPGSITILPRTP